MSFRTRVACLIAAVVTSVTLVVTIGFLYVAGSQARNSLDIELEERSSKVANFLKSPRMDRLLSSSQYSSKQPRFLHVPSVFIGCCFESTRFFNIKRRLESTLVSF